MDHHQICYCLKIVNVSITMFVQTLFGVAVFCSCNSPTDELQRLFQAASVSQTHKQAGEQISSCDGQLLPTEHVQDIRFLALLVQGQICAIFTLLFWGICNCRKMFWILPALVLLFSFYSCVQPGQHFNPPSLPTFAALLCSSRRGWTGSMPRVRLHLPFHALLQADS